MTVDRNMVLHWEPLALEESLFILADAVRREIEATPSQNKRTLKKLKRWDFQLDHIMNSIENIESHLAPRLESILGVPMQNSELLLVALFQPSTKNLFLEIQTHYLAGGHNPLNEKAFKDLVALSDSAQVFALVGDAAISLAVLHHLWKQRADDVGNLTLERSELVSNEHLARVCDLWHLYDNRIHFDPVTSSKSEIEHDKGTLLEAIFGIIYIEHGFFKVKDLIVHLV